MDNQFTYEAFTTYLNDHRLMGSMDIKSNQVFLPPRPVNPQNFSTQMDWKELSGEGVIDAFTIVHIAPTAMIEAGYGRKNPYCVGVVKTAEGPRISAQILGVDVCNPESIKIGSAVKAVFIDRGEGESRKTFLAFEVV